MARRFYAGALLGLALALNTTAQDNNGVAVHGSIQADFLFPETDYAIGATEKYNTKALTNDYADLALFSKYVEAGFRFEYLSYPLPGFEPDFKGWGVPNFYAKGKWKGMELTGGDFYEQFGSGFILRTYEERALGIDNSIRGARLKINTLPGLRLTLLGGFQRVYWDWRTSSQVYGADAEFDFNQYIKGLRDRSINLTFGASWVLKNEHDETIIVPGTNNRLNLPHKINAMDLRLQFNRKGLNLQGEFAMKAPDPSFDNNYTYRHGTALMLAGTYSRSGWSAMLQAKRSEDMSFRSRRSQEGMAAFINSMPPFTYQHTYALAALNPYATQMAPGEWAFQGAFSYAFKKGTPLGGKYGTKMRLNASWILGIQNRDEASKLQYGENGLSTGFFDMNETYYSDVNLQIDKKIVRDFQLTFMYAFQKYNKTVVEGHGGMVNSNIFILDGKYKISKKLTLRAELQYLTSPWFDENGWSVKPGAVNPETGQVEANGIKNPDRDPGKDWAYGIVELSVAPYLMFSASDMWNCGDKGTHYYMFNITGTYRSNRLMLGYGRTRAGFNCSGGVCRWVPATRGFTISYNYNF